MQSTIQEIEKDTEELRSFIFKAQTLEKLCNNPDFQLIITEGFCKEEAIRLVSAKGDPSMQGEKQQAAIMKAIDGIGVLQGYFHTIYQQADQAANAIATNEEELEELRNEGAEE